MEFEIAYPGTVTKFGSPVDVMLLLFNVISYKVDCAVVSTLLKMLPDVYVHKNRIDTLLHSFVF